jgi:hypothetical protein
MSNLAKRVEVLERVVGVYDGGVCVCRPPSTFMQIYYQEDEQPPVLVDPGLCERCGLKQHPVTIKVVYDDDLPDKRQLQADLIKSDFL